MTLVAKIVGAVARQAVRTAKAVGLGVVSRIVRSGDMPVFEFDTDLGTGEDIQNGGVSGMFMRKRPGDALGMLGSEVDHVYSLVEALSFIDQIPAAEITWADRRLLRMQVKISGLE